MQKTLSIHDNSVGTRQFDVGGRECAHSGFCCWGYCQIGVAVRGSGTNNTVKNDTGRFRREATFLYKGVCGDFVNDAVFAHLSASEVKGSEHIDIVPLTQ